MRVALVAVLALSGCLTPYGGGDVGSGIFGVAMMGPTCPVERNPAELRFGFSTTAVVDPPDPACEDRPYEGNLTATSASGGAAGTFSPDALGRFNVSLPPGDRTHV